MDHPVYHPRRCNTVLVVDWDETVTVRDTTALLALAAEQHAPKERQFAYFTTKYLESYAQFEKLFHNEYGDITTHHMETQFQKRLRAIEMHSIRRLEEARFFLDVPKTVFEQLALSIELRPDAVPFLRSFCGAVYVLSSNWCRSMIETCLAQQGLECVTVMANDLETHNGRTTGIFSADFDIRTGYDKACKLQELRNAHPTAHIVFVGDSHGDVLAIVEADVGIVISNGKAKQTLQKIAEVHSIVTVNECATHERGTGISSANVSPVVYEGTWAQIAASLPCK